MDASLIAHFPVRPEQVGAAGGAVAAYIDVRYALAAQPQGVDALQVDVPFCAVPHHVGLRRRAQCGAQRLRHVAVGLEAALADGRAHGGADVLHVAAVDLTHDTGRLAGDARGGAALSIRHITGKPIKFLGVGEKTEALEPFHPDRIASRILGMGDVLSLIEDIESKVDRAQAEKLASKLKKGDGFDLNDFLEQLRQMKNMGGMASLMGKLPGMGQIPDNVKSQMDDKVLVRMEAIINSMTMKERAKPEIIKGSRKRRIAAGCGMQVQDVNRLLKQFDDMQRMMKKMKKGGMAKMMRSMKGMMPPGFPGR